MPVDTGAEFLALIGLFFLQGGPKENSGLLANKKLDDGEPSPSEGNSYLA